MRLGHFAAFTALGVLASSCQDSPDERPDCDGVSLELFVDSPVANTLVSGDVAVRGRVRITDDLAVHYVRVAGTEVTRRVFNFASWDGTATIATLKAQNDPSPTILVETRDTCGNVAEQRVQVRIKQPVTALSVNVSYPNQAFAPSTKPIPAIITIAAAPTSAGGIAGPSAPTGWTLFGLTPEGRVQLVGDGVRQASAVLTATCSPPAVDVFAPLVLTASESSATAFLRCAGPPALQAATFNVSPGGSPVLVEVLSKGDVAGCQATAPAGFSVLSGTVDLGANNAVTDTTGNGQPDFRVSAAAGVGVGAKVDVVCWDSYMQSTRATFAVAAP